MHVAVCLFLFSFVEGPKKRVDVAETREMVVFVYVTYRSVMRDTLFLNFFLEAERVVVDFAETREVAAFLYVTCHSVTCDILFSKVKQKYMTWQKRGRLQSFFYEKCHSVIRDIF